MIRVGIIGPTGYAGFHLIDLLLRHPQADIVYLGARREQRPHITDIWPALKHRIDMRCALLGSDPIPEMDLAFIALPHTVAMDYVPAFLARGIRVIDISADYRLNTPEAYKTYYHKDHTDQANLGKAAYGLCELFRDEIAAADLIANPGCYPTAIELALAPILSKNFLRADARIIVDAKSGVTGAGKNPKPHLHFPEANESLTAYKVGVHQHTGEILQTLTRLAGNQINLLFVPHLIPMDRGILATCYVPLADNAGDDLTNLFRKFYANAPFVRVCEDTVPNTKHVTGTNFTDISIHHLGHTAVIISAIDNLIKGASGQAVQNMNLRFNLDETTGLL